MKKYFFFTLLMLFSTIALQARNRILFDSSWLFTLADSAQMSQTSYNDSKWRLLDLPHDWAIEGDFSAGNPSGAGGGALPGGIGWYRKHFRLSDLQSRNDRYFIAFDGVYMNSTVYLNGHELGHRPYGYSSFEYDMTPYLNTTGDNVLAVKVDNSDQPNSRWYSGCGIFRHVWLVTSSNLHIAQWGIHVVANVNGDVSVDVDLVNNGQGQYRPVVKNTVYDPQGKIVATKASASLTQKLHVKSPQLWSIESPKVYSVKTEIVVDGKVVDTEITTTGFRSFRFDAKTGFWLNGKNFKLNGVCEHHDLGCLGAAFNEDAMRRKLIKLKEMGVNALRCSHNPPAPELLNLCDTMGLVVMDESFDMWRRRRRKTTMPVSLTSGMSVTCLTLFCVIATILPSSCGVLEMRFSNNGRLPMPMSSH